MTRVGLAGTVVVAGCLLATAIVLRAEQSEKKKAESTLPSDADKAWRAFRASGRGGILPEYKVVCLPKRSIPVPSFAGTWRGTETPEQTEEKNKQQRESDGAYARELTEFFADLASNGWAYVTFVETNRLVLLQRTYEQ
jgi:hypothetical protein